MPAWEKLRPHAVSAGFYMCQASYKLFTQRLALKTAVARTVEGTQSPLKDDCEWKWGSLPC